MFTNESIHTVVIGAGQAGLAAGYHLKKQGVQFAILEANERIGDSWRKRWDSLRLFTPAKYDAIDGMPFPAPAFSFPTKDEMADYLESYAKNFKLPVRTGVQVDKLSRRGNKYIIRAGDHVIEADNAIVAMASYQKPKMPSYASQLDSSIVQIHSSEYVRPSQMQPGDVLLVGAGNSGAEIALEVSKSHRTWLSGRPVDEVPFDVAGLPARLIVSRMLLRVFFHRVATLDTPIGRKMQPEFISHGTPLIRTKSKHLAAAGVQRVAKVAGVRDGKPLLEDGRVIDVANVIWCTGFHTGFSWIDLPVFDENGRPRQYRGVVSESPGLYFVGLAFLYAASSTMIHGVSRDAEYLASQIAARRSERPTRVAIPA